MSAQTLTRAPLRMRFALIGTITIGLLLGARLFHWQILQWDRLKEVADGQQRLVVSVPARRGDILTRDGVLLATDVFEYKITIAPASVRKKEELAKELAPILKQPQAMILANLKSSDSQVVLAREATIWVATKLHDLKTRIDDEGFGLASLQVQGTLVRRYPAGAFAAHVIGYVNLERAPAHGVEQFKDGDLRGTDGKIRGIGDALRDLIPIDLPINEPAVDGASIVLTIDSAMQRIVETELAKAIRESRATGGCVIVLDPKTGAILALAVSPTADLNEYRDPANVEKYLNTAVGAQYEPGSVFKVVTIAAGLDAGTISASSVFDDNGVFTFGGGTIKNHDDLAPGRVLVVDVLRQSLNVESAKISVGLGVDRFYEYVRRFGFGAPTRVDLAGEIAGEVKTPGDGKWRDIDLATNSFGQGIAATPLQMAAAIGAIANQGKLMRPYVVARVQGNGKDRTSAPLDVRQVIRPETARVLTQLMADAIGAESTNKALVPGYRIAGKTGTSQIPIYGSFDPRWTIASFGGFLPADDPRFVILVKLDKPQSSEFGSQVASPVFSAVAKQLVALVGLPPDNVRLGR